MGRRLRLLNLTLGLVAVLIATALARTWVTPVSSPSSSAAPKASLDAPALTFVATARPPLAQFDVLLEKNPFKQPPPIPVRPAMPGAPLPPPAPLPTLVGTILVDNERRAILSDKGKANIYSIGQEVAGGTLTAISEDRVLFKRGSVVSELTLKSLIQPGVSPPPLASPQPAAGHPPTPSLVPLLPPPQAIEGAPTPQAEPPSRLERRRLRPRREGEPAELSQETWGGHPSPTSAD